MGQTQNMNIVVVVKMTPPPIVQKFFIRCKVFYLPSPQCKVLTIVPIVLSSLTSSCLSPGHQECMFFQRGGRTSEKPHQKSNISPKLSTITPKYLQKRSKQGGKHMKIGKFLIAALSTSYQTSLVQFNLPTFELEHLFFKLAQNCRNQY